MKIKPTAQGIFYPESKEDIINLFETYNKHECVLSSKLAIVPHAGYEFSGKIAFQTYNCLDKETENIFIIAPAIYNRIYGCVTCDFEAFETPLGDIKILPAEVEINNDVFECESSLTVQLPFIKYFFPNATVTPILYGCEDFKTIAQIISENIEKSIIIIPTNLSRFIPEREAIRLDNQTARHIERLKTDDLDIELADGAIGICGAIEYAKQNGFNFVQTGLTNSSKVNENTSNVVGYGGWYLITQ